MEDTMSKITILSRSLVGLPIAFTQKMYELSGKVDISWDTAEIDGKKIHQIVIFWQNPELKKEVSELLDTMENHFKKPYIDMQIRKDDEDESALPEEFEESEVELEQEAVVEEADETEIVEEEAAETEELVEFEVELEQEAVAEETPEAETLKIEISNTPDNVVDDSTSEENKKKFIDNILSKLPEDLNARISLDDLCSDLNIFSENLRCGIFYSDRVKSFTSLYQQVGTDLHKNPKIAEINMKDDFKKWLAIYPDDTPKNFKLTLQEFINLFRRGLKKI